MIQSPHILYGNALSTTKFTNMEITTPHKPTIYIIDQPVIQLANSAESSKSMCQKSDRRRKCDSSEKKRSKINIASW